MIEGIDWLGHGSFRLTGSLTVYIDPWKLAGDLPPADVILVTHDHYDHFNRDDIGAIRRPDTVLIGPPSVAGHYGDKAISIEPGGSLEIRGMTITAVHAYNTNKFRAPGEVFHPKGRGVGYVLDLDGRRIYHAGDTDSIPEMEGIAVNIALLPIGGTYTMTAGEAAEACHVIKADVVVPMHWGDVTGTRADAERLSRICRYPVDILEAGS